MFCFFLLHQCAVASKCSQSDVQREKRQAPLAPTQPTLQLDLHQFSAGIQAHYASWRQKQCGAACLDRRRDERSGRSLRCSEFASALKLQIKPQFKLQIQRWGAGLNGPAVSICPPPLEISVSAICKMRLFSSSAHGSEDIYPQHILSSWSSLLSFLGSHIRQGQRGAAARDADKLSDSLFKKERAL